MSNYINLGLKRQGSIFEDDLITQTIRAYITSAKKEKNSVLIIDDFDRLDPEHIFRLLNIFSLHNDYLNSTYNNKFGFDKIIIVCDIDEIKNFYHYKYGPNANFQGYIEKFCSSKFHRFSIEEAVINFINNKLSINYLSEDSKVVLNLILTHLINTRNITLRSLMKYQFVKEFTDFELERKIFRLEEYCNKCSFIESNHIKISSKTFPFIKVLSILINITGDLKKFQEIFDQYRNIKTASKIESKFSSVIVRQVVLLSHLSRNHNKFEKLCITAKDTSNRYCHHQINKKHFDTPQVFCFGKSYNVNLQWSKEKKYDGSENYFQNSRVLVNKSPESSITFAKLFDEISLIIKYLNRGNKSYKI